MPFKPAADTWRLQVELHWASGCRAGGLQHSLHVHQRLCAQALQLPAALKLSSGIAVPGYGARLALQDCGGGPALSQY